MEIIKKIETSTRYLDRILEGTALICLGISVLGAVVNVFLRYVMDMSYQLIEEICRYAIIYGVFAYIGPLIKKGDHLKMDILQGLLKGKRKFVNEIFISILLFASFVFLFRSSFIWTASLLSMKVMTVSGIMLMYIPTLAIPIGMFLGCLYSAFQLIIDYRNLLHYKRSDDIVSVESNTGS
ncbi:TRAP transporter small permease [Schinkia sp. CFF1]